jgi:alcohol dehydrogenase class IV
MTGLRETVFVVEGTPLKFGTGASAETGWELTRRGVTRVLLVTDPGVAAAGIADTVAATVREAGIAVDVFAEARVEPSLDSAEAVAAVARAGRYDGFLGVGGGSAMDTAKVAALAAASDAPLIEHVNPPVGGGRAVPLLAPLVMVPTTSGTGSEATTVAVLDLPDQRNKSGISHRNLRPAQAIVDPLLVRTAPAPVIAASGLDVVCHAAESFLARRYNARPAPQEPGLRPPYQGSNPVADVWSGQALELGGRFLRRAVADGSDLEARGMMMLAATMAGVGFGSAGVHVPHACAYPIASQVRHYRPQGWPGDHDLIPHGFSVAVTAPAAFRWTYASNPRKHVLAAELLTDGPVEDDDEDTFPAAFAALMRDVGAPPSLASFGYGEADLDALTAGAASQHRLLALSPIDAGEAELRAVLRASL